MELGKGPVESKERGKKKEEGRKKSDLRAIDKGKGQEGAKGNAVKSSKVDPVVGKGVEGKKGDPKGEETYFKKASPNFFKDNTFLVDESEGLSHGIEEEKDDDSGKGPPKEITLKVNPYEVKGIEIIAEVKDNHEKDGKTSRDIDEGVAKSLFFVHTGLVFHRSFSFVISSLK